MLHSEKNGLYVIKEIARMLKLDDLDKLIADFIQNEESSSFEEIAILIHSFQFQNNSYYRHYCYEKGIGNRINSINSIPSFEIESFKGSLIPSIDNLTAKQGMFFETSGTTSGKKAKIYRDEGYFKLRSMTIKRQGKDNWFKRFGCRVPIICLDKANRRNQGDFKDEFSVLNNIIGYFGNHNSMFYDHIGEFNKIISDFNNAASKHAPIVLIGPSYYFSDIIIKIKKDAINLSFNDQILIMDSGGLKNKCAHQSYEQYKKDLFDTFHLRQLNYKNTFAMTEIGVQLSDDEQGEKIVPHWAKVKLVDENGLESKEKGRLVIFDLLNRANLFCIKTNDRAYYSNNGLIIKGKEL